MRERNHEKIQEFLGRDICSNLPKSFPHLYERIVYIIIKFLQTEEKVLFLQFPIEDLTNKENKKTQFWDEICDVIAYAIRLSMKSEEMQLSKLSYPGDWYNNGDKFLLLPSSGDEYSYYFLEALKEDKTDSIKLNFYCKNPKYGTYTRTKNEILQKATAVYKIDQIPAQIKNGYAKCCKEIELLKCRKFGNKQFSSAVAICPAYSHQLPHAGTYVKPTVDICTATGCYPDSDILAIVGDKAFGLVQGAVNSLEPNGLTKKVLVFGTQPTTPLLDSKPVTITLSFQEIHKYCAPEEVEYFDPEFIEIDFPWLKDVLNKLKEILKEYSEQFRETSDHIYNWARLILSDIQFSKEILDWFKERFVSFLDDRIEEEDAPGLYEKIMEWLDGLSYDSDSNPKRDYASNNKGTIILSNRSIPKQLKLMETYGSNLFLGSPHHRCKGTDNPISSVMRYHLFPKLHCLYYKEIETDKMKNVQKNIERDPFFTFLEISEKSYTQDPEQINLDDYKDLSSEERDFYDDIYGQERVRLSFTDESQEDLCGEILLVSDEDKLERIHVTDIMVEEGSTIIFYSQKNDIFNKLFNAYYSFVDEKDISHYVNLWQNALKELVNKAESMDAVCKELKISKAVLNNHIDGRSKFMQKKSFERVLDILKNKGLINEDEKQYIKAAKSFYNKSSISFGSQLKDALYRFRIDEKDKSDFLRKLEDKTGYGAKELMREFLYTKTIKE